MPTKKLPKKRKGRPAEIDPERLLEPIGEVANSSGAGDRRAA